MAGCAAYGLRDLGGFIKIIAPLRDAGLHANPPSVHSDTPAYVHELAFLLNQGEWAAATATAERAYNEAYEGDPNRSDVLATKATTAAILFRTEESRKWTAQLERAIMTKAVKRMEVAYLTQLVRALTLFCDGSWTVFEEAILGMDNAKKKTLARARIRSANSDQLQMMEFDFFDPHAVILGCAAERRGGHMPATEFSNLEWLKKR